MGWLSTHLNEFVKPRLGFIPEQHNFFNESELTVIKNMWRSAKVQAASRPMLLAGRDAFIFEVLAQREGYPTTFRPDISRATAALIPRGQYERFYLLDTGFVGSIAKTLRIQNFGLASALQLIAPRYQLFPRLKGARSLALKIEATPKYWTSGKSVYDFNIGEHVISQQFSEDQEFTRAAGVTIQIYKNSARRFVDTRSPISVGRW